MGPTMIAMIVTENPLVNPHLYDKQIPPVVYLSGVLLFVAGFAVIRAHNRWAIGWPLLVTLMGWLTASLGLFRMFAPGLYQKGAQANTTVVLIGEGIILAIGIFLTFKAYLSKN